MPHKARLIVVGPLPPPIHGVAVSTLLALKNPILAERFEIDHLDTTDPRPLSNMGKWDLGNIALGISALRRLARKLHGEPGVLYLPLSENRGGFLRDSLFIHLAARRDWRVAVHIRNSLFRRFYDPQPAVYKHWIRLTLRRAAGLAVLGDSLRGLFSGLVPDERVTVVPNGTPYFNANGIEPDRNQVLYLSNFHLKKGIDRAVEAARLVLARRPQTHFVFAGEWESLEVERAVREIAADANGAIEFRTPVDREVKDHLMASSWVLLFPVAWGEGHPRILLEALAAGLPAVTTDRATISETVGDGEAGFVLPEPDPHAIADRLLRLLDDVELRSQMSAAARERHRARFTQEEADRRLAEWLSHVVAG